MYTPQAVSSNTNHNVSSVLDTQAQLQQDYNNIRAATLELCMPLQIEDYVIQTAPFMSPPRWHLGHTAWFFEMLLTRFMPEYRIHSEEYLYYFNSYYEGFGTRINRQKRGSVSRPTVQETMMYRSRIDGHMNILIERIPTHPDATEIMRLLRLGLEHEMQHQELLVYDIKHLLANQYAPSEQAAMPKSTVSVEGEAEFTGGLMQLGTNVADHLFTWDNECPLHTTFVNPFAMDKRLVTNKEFLAFMRSGGYTDYRWWLSAGWEWLSTEGIDAPMYWERAEDGTNTEKTTSEQTVWNIRDYRGVRSADNNEPVTHISYYEAAAFAKWRGKRLPSEAEWEFAAMQQDSAMAKNTFPWGNVPIEAAHANLFENKLWCCSEAGSFAASSQGIYQLIGDAWEWTTSDYAPYPGFTTQFDEYNDKWFINQKVLRGASYATPRMSVRATYRNFFAPSDRWMVSGFRCARTLMG